MPEPPSTTTRAYCSTSAIMATTIPSAPGFLDLRSQEGSIHLIQVQLSQWECCRVEESVPGLKKRQRSVMKLKPFDGVLPKKGRRKIHPANI